MNGYPTRGALGETCDWRARAPFPGRCRTRRARHAPVERARPAKRGPASTADSRGLEVLDGLRQGLARWTHSEPAATRGRDIDRAVLAGLVALSGVLGWRAASQAITYDEAFTWLAFVRGSFTEVFTRYTGNNHVLFSLLAWTSTHVSGASELALRLPSLVAGVAYFAIARGLAGVLSSTAVSRALVTAALVLNPCVLDFLVAARGYGLALAALLFALWRVLRRPDAAHTTRHLVTVGLALGASIASNLSAVFPAAGIAAAAAAPAALGSRHPGRSALRAMLVIGGTAAAVAGSLLIRPLQERHPGFYYGADTFAEASRSLVAASLQFHTGRWRVPDAVVDAVAFAIVPAALVTWVAAACVILFAAARSREDGMPPSRTWPMAAAGSAIGVTLAAVTAAHAAADIPLPMNRTGLYWLPLFVVGIAASRQAVANGTNGRRWAARACDAALAALAAAFLAQFNITHFREWKFDAGSREIFELVERWPCPVDRSRRLTTTPWLYEPALEFYRVVRDADHVRPLDVEREQYTPGDADFYVVRSPDEVKALSAVAAPVFTHPVSGATLVVDRALVSCE